MQFFAVRWLKESLSDEIRSKAVVENRQTKLPIERIRLLIAHVGRPTVGPLMQITLISTFSMALMEATLFYLYKMFWVGVFDKRDMDLPTLA